MYFLKVDRPGRLPVSRSTSTGTLLRWDGRRGASSMTAPTGISASGWWSSPAYSREAGSWANAAGYGEPALTAARKAGPEGRVVATDISAEMLAFGRDRAAAAGVGNVEFRQSDALSLDFPHASFDAAVSRWGIIFEPSAAAAAGRIRGFLKPGSRMAIASWGEPDQVPFLSIPMRTTMQRLEVSPPPAGMPGPPGPRPLPSAGCSKEVGSRTSPRGEGRGHLPVRLPGALHRLRYGHLRPDPGDDRAARGRGPKKRPGTRSRRPQRMRRGWLEAAELLERGAARLGNRLTPVSHYLHLGRYGAVAARAAGCRSSCDGALGCGPAAARDAGTQPRSAGTTREQA